VTPSFEALQRELKNLPGLGYRSAERIALHLLIERPERLESLLAAMNQAKGKVAACPICGNISEDGPCPICTDPRRENGLLCLVEQVPDLMAMEKAGAWGGRYHVLQGRLSPIRGIDPSHLNLGNLAQRLEDESITEVMLALSNDIEGEATCHYLRETFLNRPNLTVTRIGFGLPSGGNLTYADAVTLKSALAARRPYA
jgi:recombination protein RecR